MKPADNGWKMVEKWLENGWKMVGLGFDLDLTAECQLLFILFSVVFGFLPRVKSTPETLFHPLVTSQQQQQQQQQQQHQQ